MVLSEYGTLKWVALAIPALDAFDHLTHPGEASFVAIPDARKVQAEMNAYAGLLTWLGVKVTRFFYDQYPNQIFLRDLAFLFPDAALLANPKLEVRSGEENELARVLSNLQFKPVYSQYPFEAADVLIISPDQMVVATGNRTAPGAVELLRRVADKHSIHVKEIEAINSNIPQHLLGHKHIVGPDRLLSRFQLSDDDLGMRDVLHLPETVEIVEGYAMNIVTVAENTIIMPAGCPQTRDIYTREGLTVYETPMTEVHKMGGGLACITLPLERDSV